MDLMEFMEDATGRTIWYTDTVAIKLLRGWVVIDNSRTATTLNVQLVDNTTVEANPGDLTVVDRCYICPGMVVASVSDPAGQLGVVTATATEVDVVQLHDGSGTATVSPAELRRVDELIIGDYVVPSSGRRWLGRVMEVFYDVDVLFDDGGRCRVTEADKKLQPVVKSNYYSNTRFWAGQRVMSAFFKTARWLNGSYWKPSYVQGTVSMVKITGVLVNWVASPHPESLPPHNHQKLGDLVFFHNPTINYWNVGDRCFLRNNPVDHDSSCDKQKSNHQSSCAPSCGRNSKHRRQKPMRRRLADRREAATRFDFERPMSVADTRTTVDVLWQDGTRQHGVPSVLLRPFAPKNEHDVFPGQHVRRVLAAVVDHAQSGDNGGPESPVGVVRSLDCKDQTVRVSWLKGDNNDVGYDETVSAYHLGRILDHNVFYGNIVIRLAGEHMPTSDLSWVGHVFNLCDDGQVQVKWEDGSTTEVLPHEIAVVKEQSCTDIIRQMGNWILDDGSEDAEGEKNQADPIVNTGNYNEGENNTDDGLVATRIIARVISAITRLGTNVLEQGKRFRVMSGWTMVEGPSNAGLAAASENVEPVSSVVGNCPEISTSVAESLHGQVEGKAEADATGVLEAFRFQQFDIVKSPPDHRYLDNAGQDVTRGRIWTKRVQREWKILENHLPDTIYVRAFEDRMDLLRAVMVGVCGTPYQDGLFFFDLQLPPSYPDSPPLVNYRSLGIRVNPNLYPSGTVCLSLLGTFGGKATELWSPESSTVLQVLVSIQGLVLTTQPYYNEAGHESQVGTPMGQRNELPYSENTYLLSLQTMMHLLRRPPAGFEGFVRDHFRRRGRHVLQACEAYGKGCLVGTLDDEANATEASMGRPCSAGFRLALDTIVPRLMVEFAEIGADGCERRI